MPNRPLKCWALNVDLFVFCLPMVMFIIPKNGVTQQLTSNNSNCLQLTSPVFSVSIFFGRNVPIAYNHQQQLLPPINLPIRCVNPIVDSRIPISRIPCDVNRIPTCCWFVSFLISYHQFHYNDIMSYNITWHHITLHISIYHMYIYISFPLMCLGNSKLHFTPQVRIDAGLQRACGRGEAVPVPGKKTGRYPLVMST